MGDEELLAEQRAYYRARAPEYDDWWQRRGRYDRGGEESEDWHRQIGVVEQALESFGATGRVLELAGGTGWWTQRLARTAHTLTVVDASPETLELNRRRVDRDDVEYVVADLFEWEPGERSDAKPGGQYDVVFFSFWLSHVPRNRFAAFWAMVRDCLAPGGRVFLIDNRDDPQPTSIARDPYVLEYEDDLHRRELSDGSEYRVVKVMYEPDELASLIATEGWEADIDATRWFLFGSARPA